MSLKIWITGLWIVANSSLNAGVWYEWVKERKPYNLTDQEKSFPEYLLKVHRQYDYDWIDDGLVMYMTDHRITRVTNPETIQRNNRIYIDMSNVIEVVDLRARSISKSGKMVNFDKGNLKEIMDERAGHTYKIFAIEGVEAESEVEYFYTLKMKGKVFESMYLQSEVPTRDVTFLLNSPVKLKFEFRVYNDTALVKMDTLKGRAAHHLHMINLRGLPKENYSSFDADRKRIQVKMAYNYLSGDARLNTWADAGKTFYKSAWVLDDDARKNFDKFMLSFPVKNPMSKIDRIKHVESVIKGTFKLIERYNEPDLVNLSAVLKYKQGNKEGLTTLLLNIYTKLGIPVQLVVTCDRETKKFDSKFDSWTFLDDYVLHFPETNGFLSPGSAELRYPLVESKYTAQAGLFIEPVTVGGVHSAIARVREIPPIPYNLNADNLDISVQFSADLTQNVIKQVRTFTGYQAAYLNQDYLLGTAEEKEKIVRNLFRSTFPDMKINEWKATTSEAGEICKFVAEVTVTTEHFLEKAGAKVLFKIGELIGPQSELYRDDSRQTNIENTYNRGYDREISVRLPDGYTLGNEQALSMDVTYKEGERTPFLFISTYARQAGVLKISINEYYKEIYAPLNRYEDFRRVINAAADFNKITLVLTKQ